MFWLISRKIVLATNIVLAHSLSLTEILQKNNQMSLRHYHVIYSHHLRNTYTLKLLRKFCLWLCLLWPSRAAVLTTVKWLVFVSRLLISHYKLLQVDETRATRWNPGNSHVAAPNVETGFIVKLYVSYCSVSDRPNAPMNAYLNSITTCLARKEVRLQTAYLNFVLCTLP